MDFYGNFSGISLEAKFSTILFSQPTYDTSYIQENIAEQILLIKLKLNLSIHCIFEYFFEKAIKVTRFGHHPKKFYLYHSIVPFSLRKTQNSLEWYKFANPGVAQVHFTCMETGGKTEDFFCHVL